MWKITVSSLFFCAASFCDNTKDLDKFIEEMRLEYKVPGASVAVVKGERVEFVKGYGLTKDGGKEKVNAQTIFQLASVSKTFTAAALAIEVDRGHLEWDKEVIHYLPPFALKDEYATQNATARDLLAHRTSLPSFTGDLLGKLGYSDSEILSRVRYIEPATSFRNRAYYSNVGYFLAGALLEKVSNLSWEQFVRERLLMPLNMTHSGFAANLDNPNVATPYAFIEGNMKALPWDRTGGFPAAGAVTSNAEDMGNWMIMHLNEGKFRGKQILKPDVVKSLFEPSMVSEISFSELPPISASTGFNFGLGWGAYYYNGHLVVEKGGALDGVRTLVTLIPDMKLGITVLCNLNLTVFPEAVRAKFLEQHLGVMDKDVQSKIKEHAKELEKLLAKEPKGSQPLSHKLDQYTGTFESPLYGTFKVLSDQNHLWIEAGPANLKGSLTHWGGDTFLLEWPYINSGNQKVTFLFSLEGKVSGFQTESLGSFSCQ